MDGRDAFSRRAVAGGYDAVADVYATAFGDELAELAVDAQVLDAAHRGAPAGLALDVGCGPGQCAAWLSAAGRPAVGFDLAPSMLREARRLAPGVPTAVADLRALPVRDASSSLVVCRYVLQHLPRTDLRPALDELRRVLRVDGCVMIATHLGSGEVELGELLGRSFEPMGGTFHGRGELLELLHASGFDVVVEHERGPVAGEAATQRLYVVARAWSA